MGIKGIYNELGCGERISLAKLAAEHLESTGRPLRLAVDFSIWQFQAQAARGGANPAIRTLFFRLVRLVGLGIRPVFVVDGPHKPQIKRNKRSGRGGDAISSAMGRELIQLFGFLWHQAPGEAEAECALMQQMGLVDAVLSEDVDTIMFGCTTTLRNWSAEGAKRAGGVPTHVTVYRVGSDGNMTGIDRHGMVLVAMMSGGDYLPDGIPGFGVKTACEAARAGFGESLCMIKSESPDSFAEWRKTLAHELRTNASGFFRSKHKTLAIPDDFPHVDTLQCYTHPVVSRKRDLMRAMKAAPWGKAPDLDGLRMFAERTFDWQAYATTVKFVNLLAPSMLVHRLLAAAATGWAKPQAQALVMKIAKHRNHTSTDGLTEMRVMYVPSDIVKVELPGLLPGERGGMLPFSRDGLAINSDHDDDDDDGDDPDLGYLSDIPGSGDDEAEAEAAEILPKMNPDEPQLTWVLEAILRVGAPEALADYEARLLKKQAGKKARKGKASKGRPDPDAGAILKFLKPTKMPRAKTPLDQGPDNDVPRPPPRRKKKAVVGLDSDLGTVDLGSEADLEDEPRVSTPKRKANRSGHNVSARTKGGPRKKKMDIAVEPESPPKKRRARKSEEPEPEDPNLEPELPPRMQAKATSTKASTTSSSEPVLSPARLATQSKQLPTTAAMPFAASARASASASAPAPAPAPAPDPLLVDSPPSRRPTFDRSHVDDLLFPRTPKGTAQQAAGDGGKSQAQTIIMLDSPSLPASLSSAITTTTATTAATCKPATAIFPPPESAAPSWKIARQTLEHQASSTVSSKNKQFAKSDKGKKDGTGPRQMSIMNFTTTSKKSRDEACPKINNRVEQTPPSKKSSDVHHDHHDDPFLDSPPQPTPVVQDLGKNFKPMDIPKEAFLDHPPQIDPTAARHAPKTTTQQQQPSAPVIERTTKRMMIPRLSDGFFEIIEMNLDEAAEAEGGSHSARRRVYRFSDVSIIDLTGED